MLVGYEQWALDRVPGDMDVVCCSGTRGAVSPFRSMDFEVFPRRPIRHEMWKAPVDEKRGDSAIRFAHGSASS